ncbi:MAG: type III toxin-antitoxin system ToxN/AbiQ family toxin [Clostridia bacterium]|nr:type III toxin-antitoxin system ToxN/AbiQ family toxin [Clostridia bacterium]
MMDDKLNLYWVDMKYIRALHQKDQRVYSVSPQIGKQNRPYIGIIVTVNNNKYCIPLSKPKEKYSNMKDKIDFSKITINGKVIAGINFSRMIPVEMKQLTKVDTKKRKHDIREVLARKELYRQEIEWCNDNKDIIVNKANILYNKYLSGEPFKRKKDCLNFPELEEICKNYNLQK